MSQGGRTKISFLRGKWRIPIKRGEKISGVSQKSEAITYEKSPAMPSEAKITVKEYEVEKDDSLWKIAQKEYGDGNKWKKIYRLNGHLLLILSLKPRGYL